LSVIKAQYWHTIGQSAQTLVMRKIATLNSAYKADITLASAENIDHNIRI